MSDADHVECRAALAIHDGQAGHLLGRPHWGQAELGALPRRATALVRAGIRLETHPATVRESEACGELRAAQRGVAAHGRAAAVRVEVGHADAARCGPGSDEHNPVTPDAGAPGAHGAAVA